MRIFYVVILILFFSGCHSATSPSDSGSSLIIPEKKLSEEEKEKYAALASDFFDTTILNSRFNGSILVAKNGHIVYEKYQGYVHLQRKDTLTDTTAFHLASISKTFTSIAILDLVQNEKLSLNDSLEHFFPNFPFPGITIKMLLNHHSGLSEYLNFISENKDWNKQQYVTNNDVLEQFHTLKPALYYKTDTRFNYNNSNFVLLASIIEKVTGRSFPEYMQEKYFTPLGMKDTYVFLNSDSARSTPSFTHRGGLWKNDFLELTYGDKNVYSTPKDLLKWDRAIFNSSLIRADLLDSAFTNYNLASHTRDKYGLGFRLYTSYSDKKIVFHTGRWHGFSAIFSHLLDEDVTIIILTNNSNRNALFRVNELYNLFGNYQLEPDKAITDSLPE